ncbi:MAG TPA: AAA family ATPase, partial [Bacteroidales bacterium]|nr:AAA family ATPase [Bacteroidales bacterium]
MIQREIDTIIRKKLYSGKAIILLGARQVGKTTILKKIVEEYPDSIWFNGDDPDTISLFETISSSRLQAIFGNKKLVVIDEAQRIQDIGIKLKLI